MDGHVWSLGPEVNKANHWSELTSVEVDLNIGAYETSL